MEETAELGTAPSDRPLAWASVWPILILAFANVCSFADRQLTSILATPIRASLHLDHASIAFLGGTAFATFYGLAGLPAGLAADRFRRRTLICAAIAVWSLCTALCGLASSFKALFLARVGVGIGEAVLLPCAFSLIRDLTPPGRRGIAFALFGLGIPAGSSLGLVAGGFLNTSLASHPDLLSWLGPLAAWQKTFLILAALGLPTAAAAALLPDPPRARAQVAPTVSAGDGLAPALCFFAAIACFGILVQGIAFWTPSWLMERFQLSTASAGLRIGTINILASTLGMFVIGSVSDLRTRRSGTSGAAHTLLAASLLFIPAALLIGMVDGAGAWLGVALFYFLAIGSTTVASALALRVGPPDRAGLMGALYGLVVNLAGQGLGPLLYGWVRDHNQMSLGDVIAIATAIFALIAAVGLGLMAQLSRDRGPGVYATRAIGEAPLG